MPLIFPRYVFPRYVLPLLTLLPWTAVLAEPEFQVDVLIFGQPDRGASLEIGRPATELQLGYPANLIDLSGLQTSTDERFIDLGNNASDRLQKAASKMEQNEYRIIYRRSWMQSLPAPENTRAVLIQGGQQWGAQSELGGYITLYRNEQSIRLDTHLWLASISSDASLAGAQTGSVSSEMLPQPGETTDGISLKAEPQVMNLSRIVVLKDTRPVSSETLNYIDHPKFGMLLTISPLNAPDSEPVDTTEITE